MTSENIMKVRIASLRCNANLSQQQLAMLLSDITKRTDMLSTATISSWESGRRKPSPSMIRAMSQLFSVTENYIKGLCDDPQSNEIKESVFNSKLLYPNTNIEKIDANIISGFDGMPLFVIFKKMTHKDQWGIYNDGMAQIIMRDFAIKVNSPSIDSIYTFSPYIATKPTLPLTYKRLMEVKQVWVTILSNDQQIRRMYDGWYVHNETHTCLINRAGLTLPYEGLNVSYYAFTK